MRIAKLRVHLLSCFVFLPPSAKCLCKTWPVLKTTAKHFICRTVFSPGSITPNPSHGFCFILRVIDIHSNYHHSPFRDLIISTVWSCFKACHLLSQKRQKLMHTVKGGRQFVTVPPQNECRLNL